MNNRRQFFKSLFKGVIIAGAAPSILIPHSIDYYKWRSINDDIIKLKIVSTPVVAKVRKLSEVWTVEYEQDFQAYYNIDAEDILVKMLSKWIRHERIKPFRNVL